MSQVLCYCNIVSIKVIAYYFSFITDFLKWCKYYDTTRLPQSTTDSIIEAYTQLSWSDYSTDEGQHFLLWRGIFTIYVRNQVSTSSRILLRSNQFKMSLFYFSVQNVFIFLFFIFYYIPRWSHSSVKNGWVRGHESSKFWALLIKC